MTDMKHVPMPINDHVVAGDRLRKAIEVYEEKRAALADAFEYLQGLRSTLNEHQCLAISAREQAEEALREAKGRETDDYVEFHEMAIRKERQEETVKKMIAEQESVVEFRQIEAYGARITYDEWLSQSRHATDHKEIQGGAETLFRNPDASRLLNALASMVERVEDRVFNDPVYMATHGVDVSTVPGRGKAARAWLSNDRLEEVNKKVRMEQLAAIGEVVAQYLPAPPDAQLAGGIHRPIERLSCEVSRDQLGGPMAIARRRRELAALLGEDAA